jgi:hypothetical protein
MKIFFILASDFSGIGLFILVALAVAFTVGSAAIVVSATVGRRRWWGLLLPGLLIGVGLYAVQNFMSIGVDLMTYLILAAPELLLGFISLILWSLPRE